MKKSGRTLLILLLVALVVYLIIIIFRKPEASITRNVSLKFDYLPHSANKEIISHTAYTLSFIDEYKEPEWVAYKLSRDMLDRKSKRFDKFIADPFVPTGSATSQDYSGSGYDRGHLCPAADMSSSVEMMKESFYMSNMTPQDPSFNRGIWSKLEKAVRLWADEDSLIYIVTGPIFSSNMSFIGNSNKVAVPPAFYKVILCYLPGHKVKAIGFIIPNSGSSRALSSFMVTIDSVESRTGIDFYPDLPDDVENKVEGNIDPSDWDFDIK
ncbi:MAG: DNA/RNA non-specific endonuclease [Bacteroidota bacterium]|nr:DNA/RNA non-specific endonuclease [Bacteroidota bacterium]MDP4190959.1 DNA/RNA non-specific endonuclease [Bacteroidota bacterium]MDP4196128.1 DNA/RNA non-specific endonuclease [Bacteroidota bacterium]